MSDKADGFWAGMALLAFIFIIILAFLDYLTTPQFRILPFIALFFYSLYNFMFKFGEYLGVIVPALAKKNFYTLGGLSGVYQKHNDLHSGMVEYYISTYTRNLYHCNYFKKGEYNWIQRFITMLTPTKMIRIPDYKDKFYEVQSSESDTPEGSIFYLGSLRGAKVMGFNEILQMKLDNSLKFISELATYLQGAKASAEAAAAGQNKQIVEVSTQLSTALENISKHQKYTQAVINPNLPIQSSRRNE